MRQRAHSVTRSLGLIACRRSFWHVGLRIRAVLRAPMRLTTPQEADRPRPARPRDVAGVQGGAAPGARRGGSPRAGRAGPARLKNYQEAATIAAGRRREVPQHTRLRRRALSARRVAVPRTRPLLGAPLLRRRWLKNNGSKPEQQALQRLVEIALRTGDYENVDDYLKRRENIPPSAVEPSVPYVRGKYLYFRSRSTTRRPCSRRSRRPTRTTFRRATSWRRSWSSAAIWRALPPPSIDLLKQQPPDDTGKDIQDLARLAIGRIFYERSQFDKAIEVYLAVPRQSKLLVGGAARAGLDLHQGQGLAERLPVGRTSCCSRSRHADAPDCACSGEPRAAHEQLLSGQRRVQQSARRVRADPPAAQAGHRQAQTDPGLLRLPGRQSLDKFDIWRVHPADGRRSG